MVRQSLSIPDLTPCPHPTLHLLCPLHTCLVSQALAGAVMFQEQLNWAWFIGAGLIVLGLFLIVQGNVDKIKDT